MALKPSFEFLTKLKNRTKDPGLSYLVATVTSCALGRSETWIPQILAHFLEVPKRVSRINQNEIEEQRSSQQTDWFIKMKEAILKSSILIGIPKALEGLLKLKEVGNHYGIEKNSFFRSNLLHLNVEEITRLGDKGLEMVYKDDIKNILKMMGDECQDLQFLSRFVTYGIFLSPINPDGPLTMKETEVTILSALVPQRSKNPIFWHLRGSLRNGFSRDEVEAVQSSIEMVCHQCGLVNVGEGMPRVADVERQAEEISN